MVNTTVKPAMKARMPAEQAAALAPERLGSGPAPAAARRVHPVDGHGHRRSGGPGRRPRHHGGTPLGRRAAAHRHRDGRGGRRSPPQGGQLGGGQAGHHGQIGRHQRQHARRQEREHPGAEGDQEAERVGVDRRQDRPWPTARPAGSSPGPGRPRPSSAPARANSTSRCQPRVFSALAGSPTRRSTSAGRRNRSSMTTCFSQSRPAAANDSSTSSLTEWVSPVATT